MRDHVSENLTRALRVRWACWRAGAAKSMLEALPAQTECAQHVSLALTYTGVDGLGRRDPRNVLDPYARLNWFMFEHRREREDVTKIARLSFAPLLVVDLGLTTEYTRTLGRVFNTTEWRDPTSFAAFNNILDAVVAEDQRCRKSIHLS